MMELVTVRDGSRTVYVEQNSAGRQRQLRLRIHPGSQGWDYDGSHRGTRNGRERGTWGNGGSNAGNMGEKM